MNKNFFKLRSKDRLVESLRDKREDPFLVKEGRFHFGGLKDSFYHTDWTEESFLADNKRKEIVSHSFNFNQLKYFILLIVVGLAFLIVRTFWLQIHKNNYYNSLAEGNRLRIETIEPKRGIIYTDNLQALVRNKANFVLYFKPMDLPANDLIRDNLLRQISKILSGKAMVSSSSIIDIGTSTIKISADNAIFYKLKNLLAKVPRGSLKSYQPLFVADNIPYDEALLIDLKLPNWPGVFLSTKIRREYLLPSASSSPIILGKNSLSHILGYTGKITALELKTLGHNYSSIDYVGKTGLEYSWEKELKGVPGKRSIEVDALGRQKQVVNVVPAIDGNNLELSLDVGLQEEAEKIIEAYLHQAKLHQAAAVIMNPNNGDILALISLPAYNNNLFARGISQQEYNKFLNNPYKPLFDQAIGGQFPSGSVIKPVYAAGALQAKIITENTTVLSTGGIRLGSYFFPDWEVGGQGITNVKTAIAWSVNTFFYYIGGGYKNFKGLGVKGLDKYARLFGLGKVTGIDLPGEASGFVPTAAWKERVKKQPWYVGDTYHLAIGQGSLLVTPLQVANYISAVANGGTLYRPHLVTKILSPNNKLIKAIKPVVIRSNFISENNLQIVREGMRQAVTDGSARSLRSLPVSSAAKTGTAQWSKTEPPHAWFTAFAPYKKPEIVIAIIVQKGNEGSDITELISRDILNWYFTVDKPQISK